VDLAKAADYHLDATCVESWDTMVRDKGRPDWIVTNPPFAVELAILQHAVEIAIHGVVMMGRVSFTEPTATRGLWLARHPYDKRITLERYSFTGTGKTDSATTDWLVWAKDPLAKPFGVSAHGYRSVSPHRVNEVLAPVDPGPTEPSVAGPPPRFDDLLDLVTVEEMATFLRISRGTAYELVKSGAIRSARFGRHIRIPKQALLERRR
jgi:excisionase family DNA binding protein